jgi:hypothetical protein
VAVYVEAERCSKELGIRARGGFFENDGDFCAALLDGAFGKALVVRPAPRAPGMPASQRMDAPPARRRLDACGFTAASKEPSTDFRPD